MVLCTMLIIELCYGDIIGALNLCLSLLLKIHIIKLEKKHIINSYFHVLHESNTTSPQI
jgi:hypothetical protein